MSKTLKAIISKLSWQRQDQAQKMRSIDQQLIDLDQKIQDKTQKISRSCAISAFILPEQEIARMHFMTQQQLQQHELEMSKSALLSEQHALKVQQTLVNTKLKLLEKHQQTKQTSLQQQTILAEQHRSDEWVLQHREIT